MTVPLSIEPEPGRPDQTLAAGGERPARRPRQALLPFVAPQHLLRVMGRHETVDWGCQRRRRRSDQVGGDDDDELAFVVLELVRPEQRSEDRDVPEPGNLGNIL